MLNDENASVLISFPVDLPEANRVLAVIEAVTDELDADGELTEAQIAQIEEIPADQAVTETEIQTVAEIEPAWAKDANGDPVEARYEIDGDTVKRVVATENAALPIAADPSWTWRVKNISKCTIAIAAKSTRKAIDDAEGLK